MRRDYVDIMGDFTDNYGGFFVVIGILLAMIIVVLYFLGRSFEPNRVAQATCLANGYPNYNGSQNKGFYCIKRENGTDVVVSVDSLKGVYTR